MNCEPSFRGSASCHPSLQGRQYTTFLMPLRLAALAQGALVVVALLLALPARAAAHDIPFDVTVHGYVKPEGQRLRVIVRAPLAAMRDVDYPTRGPGLLDLSRADPVLRDAATLWLADNIAVYEGDTRLGYPRVVEVRASIAGDRSFGSYEDALAHVNGPRLPPAAEFFWNQGLLDVLFE